VSLVEYTDLGRLILFLGHGQFRTPHRRHGHGRVKFHMLFREQGSDFGDEMAEVQVEHRVGGSQ
jgi:hypothetical protein